MFGIWRGAGWGQTLGCVCVGGAVCAERGPGGSSRPWWILQALPGDNMEPQLGFKQGVMWPVLGFRTGSLAAVVENEWEGPSRRLEMT